MNNQDSNTYTTRDLYMAATFVTLKFMVIGISTQFEGKRQQPVGYFTFEKTQDLERAESRYLHGDIVVEPREFITNMKNLKAQVQNGANSPV